MYREKIKDALQKFGLTGKEAETYIVLAKSGPMKGLDIAKQLKRNKGQVYRLLKNLQKRGLVELTLESPTRFVAVSFQTALDMFAKAKRDEAALIEEATIELISDWKNISKTKIESTIERFAVINETSKILQKISEMIKETKSQLYGISTVRELIRFEERGLLDLKISKKSSPTVKLRFLTDISEQNMEVIQPLLTKIIKKGITVKERNPNLGFKLSPRMIIRDNEEMLFSITPKTCNSSTKESDVTLWTNCQSLIQSFDSIFEELWRNSENITERQGENDFTVPGIKANIYDYSEKIGQQFEQIMFAANNEIIMMITSENLNNLWKNKKLEEVSKKNVTIKIMTPIVTSNLEASVHLSKIGEVRHVPYSHLETFVIDKKHFFQFKTPISDQEEHRKTHQSIGTFYTDSSAYVERISNVLTQLWKTARPASTLTLESIMSSTSFKSNLSFPPLQKVNNVTVISKVPQSSENVLTNGLKSQNHGLSNDSLNSFRLCSCSATAIIYPPEKNGIPDLLIMVDHMHKRSTFGNGNSLMIYVKVKLRGGHFFIPAGGIGDNLNDVELRRKLQFPDSKTRQNFQLVEKNQLQVSVHDNSLFASWAVPIKLHPNFTLPPAYLLLEGYGSIKKGSTTVITPSGYMLDLESKYSNAFVTFIQSASKYSGPGIDGLFFREVRGIVTPPEQ